MRTILVVRPDNRMRKFIATLIAGAVFAISASSATAEPSSPRHIAKGDLKQFCDKNKGQWTELGINGDNGFQCEIKGIGTWSCSVKENCTLSKTMVFNKPATKPARKRNSLLPPPQRRQFLGSLPPLLEMWSPRSPIFLRRFRDRRRPHPHGPRPPSALALLWEATRQPLVVPPPRPDESFHSSQSTNL